MEDVLTELYEVVTQRHENPQEGSYTCYLFDQGLDKILKKVGEESAETIIAAKNGAGNVIGAELNGDAVRDAIVNARANNLKNIRFYKADAGEFMREAADEDEKPDVVFMDPPRAGSDRKFLDSLIKMSPKKVVYVSCNPETLARDLAYLTQNSPYKAQKIQPVDMFPHTAHIETVVLMSRK